LPILQVGALASAVTSLIGAAIHPRARIAVASLVVAAILVELLAPAMLPTKM
jgi:hypothetical protein